MVLLISLSCVATLNGMPVLRGGVLQQMSEGVFTEFQPMWHSLVLSFECFPPVTNFRQESQAFLCRGVEVAEHAVKLAAR